MENVKVERRGNTIVIGDMPQLVVDLKSQQNYIQLQNKRIPYQREVALSEDLLSGKRENVFETAVKHYYKQACDVAEGIEIAEAYRSKANTSVREKK